MGDTQESFQEHTVGVVLAGGRSQRMGADKASLLIDGESLLRRVVDRLALALPELLVVGPTSLQTLAPDTPISPDDTPRRGPLGGIVAAFDATPAKRLFVVACDMPFIEPALVRYMAHLANVTPDIDVVALRTARGVEPLHAVYLPSCLPVMRAQLMTGEGALHRLLARLRVREVSPDEASSYDPSGLSAFNANTPEEWEQAMARLSDATK